MSAAPKTHPPLHRHTRKGRAWTPKYNKWTIAFAITIATFMEVLDTNIANVALPHIAGGLSINYNKSTWILTSYLVSNAIVLPLSAWLALMAGRKRFYMACVALFTMSSMLCGFAPTLATLVMFRVLQGLGGGGLGPSEQGMLADTYTEKERPTAFAIYGMAVILAPAVGPVVGGWVTDHYNWRWIFFVNLLPGLISLFLTWHLVEDPPYLARQKKQALRKGWRPDLAGLVLLALFVGPLQVMLDRGQELNWFQSPLIRNLALVAAVAFVAMVWWELGQRDPVVNLRLFARSNYAIANLLMFLLGFVLYGAVVLLPQFLQDLMGYSAENAGLILAPGGLAMVAAMPIAGALVARIDARWLVAGGLIASAMALYHLTVLELGMSFGTIAMLRIYQGGTLAFLFIPINMLAYVGIPEGQNDDVSSMINFARNLGGSTGIAAMSTLVTRRAQVHQYRLATHVTGYSAYASDLAQRLGVLLNHHGLLMSEAVDQGYARVYRGLQAQAVTLAYIDAFWMMALICVCAVPLVFLMRKSDPRRGMVMG